ncbi:Trehalose-phosphatase, partial [Globisporangium splendens]
MSESDRGSLPTGNDGKRPSYPAAAFTPPEKKGKSEDVAVAVAVEEEKHQQLSTSPLIASAFTAARLALSSSSESGSNSNSSLGSDAAISEDDMDPTTVPTSSLPSTSWKPTMDGDVNTGTYTRVHLKVKCESRFGESVHCSGSSFVMGHFNPSESTTLVTTPEQYPYWTTVKPLILPRGVPHQYMFALFAGGVFSSWEPIESERVLVPEGREMTVLEEFGIYDSDLQLVKTGDVRDRSVEYERRKEPPRTDFEAQEAMATAATDVPSAPPSLSRTASQFLRQTKLQSRYKRYIPSNYRPDPLATLFLVCYHLPVKLTKSPVDGSWSAAWNRDSLISRSEGSIAESMCVRWVGCVTHQARDDLEDLSEDDKREITEVLSQMDCIPVFIDRELAANHYQGYCKNKLWPMFHNVDILDIYTSVWDGAEVIQWKEDRNNGKWWSAYKQVNSLLAKCVGDMCGKNDTVWVHDYHLLLFPSYLASLCKEKAMKRPSMVFFLHVPFPTSEIFRELSHGPQLLEGVLDVDVVGFHSFDHARHFLNACKRFLGLTYQSRRGGNLGVDYKGRNVVITISHVGIENTAIRDVLADPEVHEAAKRIREKHAGKILLGGIDVCQRLSGIPLKLLAFEQFFSTCTSWKDKLVLVQRCHLTNSREGDQKYSSSEIRQLVKRITEQHGPDVIDYEESVSSLSLRERIIMWLACDILMVTSIREGLNLKPLEYVFAKGVNPGSRPGVVILSEFSACCCILNGALRVNPWNITEVVNALDHALTMSEEERLGRRARDLPYITNQPAANWTKQVLSVLQEATENEEGDEEYTDMEYMDMEIGRSHVLRVGQRSDFKQLNIQRVLEAYNSSQRRVFLLDYGGTIIARENMSMYVKKDFTAVTGKLPSPRMIEALQMLTSDPRNTVFVVSGLSQRNLTTAVGHIRGLGLAAENGALYSWAKANRAGVNTSSSAEERHWHHHNFKFDWRVIREVVDPILKVYCTRTNGSVLRYMEQSIAWNFRSTDPEWGLLQANSLQSDLEEVLRDHPVNIVRKKGLLEIVPEGLNKGVVARQILSQDAGINRDHPDFLFCIGDDTTDESMFKSIYDYYAERSEESVHGRAMMKNAMDSPPTSNEGSLHHLFTCTVGKKPSHAHLYLNNVDDVEELLYTLGKRSNDEV